MILLGVHIEGPALKIAKLRRDKKNITIELLRTFAAKENETYVKPLYILQPSLQEESFSVVSGLEASDIFLRNLHLKLTDKRKVLAALPFQIDSLLPYELAEAVVIPQITKLEESKASRVAVLASKGAYLEKHLDQLKDFDIDPENVSCTPVALGRFFTYFYPELKNVFFFHFGFRQSVAICFVDKKIEVSHPLAFGLETLIEALEKDLEDFSREEVLEKAFSLDLQKVDPYTLPHFYGALFQLQKEIDRIFSFFQTKPFSQTIQEVILTGNFSHFSKFRDFFDHTLSDSYSLLASPSLPQYDSTTLESFAVPIGLSLDALLRDENSVQFRQKTYFSPSLIKKRLTSLCTYASSCVVLAILSFALSHFYLQKKEKKLEEKMHSYFPKEISSPSKNLAAEISTLEKKIGKHKRSFPFLLTMPNVSDVLAWLSSHPQLSLQSFAEGKPENLEIKHVKYQLVKYPKIESMQTLHQAKVDLEFTSSSSRLAREFHNALLRGDYMVDEKSDILWQVSDTTYRTSFFLKPKKGSSL